MPCQNGYEQAPLLLGTWWRVAVFPCIPQGLAFVVAKSIIAKRPVFVITVLPIVDQPIPWND